MQAYGIEEKRQPCPGLKFNDEGIATCKLVDAAKGTEQEGMVMEAFGIGAGCCIKARYFKDGIVYNYAALPPRIKHEAVAQIVCGAAIKNN